MGRSVRVVKGEAEEKAGRSSATLWHEVEALFAIAGACYLAISFLSYAPGRATGNAGGPVGQALAELVVQAFGLAAFLVPAFVVLVAVLVLRGVPVALSLTRGGALTAELLLIAAALALVRGPGREMVAGGWVGGFLAHELRSFFSTAGAVMIVMTGLVLTTMIATGGSLVGGLASAGRQATLVRGALAGAFARWRARRDADAPARVEAPVPVVRGDRPPERETREREAAAKKSRVPATPPIVLNEPEPRAEKTAKTKESKALKQEEFRFAPGAQYELPPTSFLDPPIDTGVRVDEDALIASSRILRIEARRLRRRRQGRRGASRSGDHHLRVRARAGRQGEPHRHPRRRSVDGAARAISVRILAPIPGKPVVGIEVSNPRRETVYHPRDHA